MANRPSQSFRSSPRRRSRSKPYLRKRRDTLMPSPTNRRYKDHLQASPHSTVSDEQARVYFAWFRASRPIFTVALETGLRLSDLLSLKWSNVDLKAGFITIVQKKTSKPVFIPISTACRQAFGELNARTLRSPLWCFTQQDGSRYSEQTFRKHFATAKAISGFLGVGSAFMTCGIPRPLSSFLRTCRCSWYKD